MPEHQPLFDALDPSLHSGVSIVGQPNGNGGRDALTSLGHTAFAARDLIPCMVGSAMPMPAAPELEHGQMLVLKRLDAFLV